MNVRSANVQRATNAIPALSLSKGGRKAMAVAAWFDKLTTRIEGFTLGCAR